MKCSECYRYIRTKLAVPVIDSCVGIHALIYELLDLIDYSSVMHFDRQSSPVDVGYIIVPIHHRSAPELPPIQPDIDIESNMMNNV